MNKQHAVEHRIKKEEVKALVAAALAPVENLPPLEKAQFSLDFIDMVAMKAFHALEERLKDNPEALQLVNAMYMLLLYESYVKEDPDNQVKWFNNQMAAEAVGEISHLVAWEVE